MIKRQRASSARPCENFHNYALVSYVPTASATNQQESVATMNTAIEPEQGFGFDEPVRQSWTFQKRTAVQAEPAETDEPPDTAAIPVEPAVTPSVRALGEAHFWPHARMAGDLSSPTAIKIVTELG